MVRNSIQTDLKMFNETANNLAIDVNNLIVNSVNSK